MPPEGSIVVDAELVALEKQKAMFAESYRISMERIRTAIGFKAEDGALHFPTEEGILKDYETSFARRMEAFDTSIVERREIFGLIKTTLDSIEKDDIPDETQDDTEVKTINTFKIGADPEFVVVKKGKPIGSLESKYGIRHRDQFGWDHSGRVAEIKPNPARSSFRLVRNLKKLVTESPAALKIINDGGRMVAGAISPDGITLGGHIHFDIPYIVKGKTIYGDSVIGADKINPTMTRIVASLDTLTACLENLDVLPLEGSKRRRSSGEYGRYGDVRQADGANRFEYRTMCSWMHSPVAAMLCLTGAKLAGAYPHIVEEVLDIREPKKSIEKLFTQFATKDIDAARVTERVFEAGLTLAQKPDTDMLESWKSLSMLSSK